VSSDLAPRDQPRPSTLTSDAPLLFTIADPILERFLIAGKHGKDSMQWPIASCAGLPRDRFIVIDDDQRQSGRTADKGTGI
jgi:hypothetical protein